MLLPRATYRSNIGATGPVGESLQPTAVARSAAPSARERLMLRRIQDAREALTQLGGRRQDDSPSRSSFATGRGRGRRLRRWPSGTSRDTRAAAGDGATNASTHRRRAEAPGAQA